MADSRDSESNSNLLNTGNTEQSAPGQWTLGARTQHFQNGMNEGLDSSPARFGADENDMDDVSDGDQD